MIKRIINILLTSVLWRLLAGFLIISIPLYIFALGTLWFSSDIVTDIEKTNAQEKMQLFLYSLDKELQNINQMLISLNNDDDFRKYLLWPNENPTYESISTQRSIISKMNIIYFSSNYIKDVFCVIPEINKQISLSGGSSDIDDEMKQLLSQIEESKTSPYRRIDGDILIYSIVFPDAFSLSNQTYYLLGVNIDQSSIFNEITLLESSQNLEVFFVDKKYNRLMNSDKLSDLDKDVYSIWLKDRESSKKNTFKINGTRYLVQTDSSIDNMMSIVFYIREDTVLASVIVFRKMFWLFSLISLLLLLVFVYLTYNHIHKPLKILVHSMKEVEQGNLNVNISYKQGDEFGYVFKQFLKMLKRLRRLIEEVLENKIQLQDLQLQQLQSQINPHFLFNSLYIGYRMAKSGESESVATLCKYLGDYFQFINRQSQKMVPLIDELKFTSTYLEIQKIRFVNKLKFFIIKDGNIDDVELPGLIIQPLVENSIMHGIEQSEGAGLIEIRIREAGDNVLIEVSDNGKGMTSQEKTLLIEKLNSTAQQTEHSGMCNVHWRLRRWHKDNRGLIIENSDLGGLKVSFSIPKLSHLVLDNNYSEVE